MDDKIDLYQGYLENYSGKKIISYTKNTLRTHNLIGKGKLRKYLSGLLSINIDKTDL